MLTPQDKLAESLAVLKKLQDKGIVAIHTKNMTRTHRERLVKNGFIKDVMKGWYIPASPENPVGESTAWYSSFYRSPCYAGYDLRCFRNLTQASWQRA